ncbi:Notchless [Hexamita inflata]|uniref:Notchless n=1 Tax=Hexamita inflata TaxID=28002 RepID=A0AA86RV98_9EUKA|nr:Notchless [Hexamita inflata]
MIFEILLSLIEQQLLTKEYHIFLENQIYKLRKQSNNELRMWFQLERLDTLLKTDQQLIISCLQSESPFLLFNETKQQIIQQILIKKLDSKQLISGLNQEFDWRVKFAILDYSLQNQTVLLNILEQSQFNDWRLNYKLIDICYKSCNVNQKAALIILKFKLFQHDERVHQLLNQQDEMLIVKKSLQNAWQEMQANAESILQSHMNTINEYISKLIVNVKNCTDITMIVDNLLQEYQFQAKLLQRIESLSYSIDVKANYLDLFYNKLTKAKNDAHVISLNVKSINIDTIETYCTLIKENNLLQQQLLDIVIYSAKYTQYAFSSSNAISILNYSNFSFKRLNFNGIRIREANLCSAFLEGVDFTNADLTGVNFTNSWLRNATFTGANMNAVSFGESLKLSLQCKIYALSVNKLGSMIIAAGDNGKIYQFQSNGKLIRSFNAHNGTISSLQFSPDGQNIISSSYDRTVKIWSTHNAKLLNTLNHEKSLFISTYSPDNELIASGGVDRILTIHTYEGIKLDEFQINSKVLTIDFYKTNQELACGTGDGAVQLWDIIKKRMFKELTGHSAQVNSVKFSIDGELLVSGSDDKTVIVWNARTGDAIKVIQMPGKVPCVCISDDCQYIAATCADNSVHVFDSKNNFKKIQQFYHADIVNTTCFSKNVLFCAGLDSQITTHIVQHGVNMSKVCHTSFINVLVFSPDGKYIASGGYDMTLKIWDSASFQLIWEQILPFSVFGIGFHEDKVLVKDFNNQYLTFNLISGQKTEEQIELFDFQERKEHLKTQISVYQQRNILVQKNNEPVYVIGQHELNIQNINVNQALGLSKENVLFIKQNQDAQKTK